MRIGSYEWLEARKKYITATDVPVILGVSPWNTPLQLYSEKLDLAPPKPLNWAMQKGIELEDEARRAFEMKMGDFFEPKFVTKDSWAAASLDGLSPEGVLVEIKCSGDLDHGLALQGKIPEKYYPQVQWQMYVSGVKNMYYFSYRPDDVEPMAVIAVHYDADYIEEILPKVKVFWECLQNKTPPVESLKDVMRRDDFDFIQVETKLKIVMEQLSRLEHEEKILREEIIRLADGKSCKGKLLQVRAYEAKGSIDYSKIEALKDVDLEAYRKPSTIRWRIDAI